MAMQLSVGAAVAVVVGGLAFPAAAAQDSPSCGKFMLTGGELRFEVAGGRYPGFTERRVVNRILIDETGREVGYLYIVNRPPKDETAGDRAEEVPHNAVVLPGGVLYALVVPADAEPDDGEPLRITRMGVVSGTDAFVDASGQIVVTQQPGLPGVYEFDLNCD